MPWGYYDGAKQAHLYHKDWQGNICAVTDQDGNLEQTTDYYPYGMPKTSSTGATVNPYKFSAKELETNAGLNHYDFGARWLQAQLPLFTTPDILSHDKPNLSPYIYCNGNPINYIDPIGLDTVKIDYSKNKWNISKPIIAEGDDIFVVTKDGRSQSFTFSAGKYGERVCALNIDITDNFNDATIGVYHVSGEIDGATGFYVVPGGYASNSVGSNRRIYDGEYPFTTPTGNEQWRVPGLGGDVLLRGIRFHPGGSNPRNNTSGCFTLYDRFDRIGKRENLEIASLLFYSALGASSFYKYEFNNRIRFGAKFVNPIKHTFQIKSISR